MTALDNQKLKNMLRKFFKNHENFCSDEEFFFPISKLNDKEINELFSFSLGYFQFIPVLQDWSDVLLKLQVVLKTEDKIDKTILSDEFRKFAFEVLKSDMQEKIDDEYDLYRQEKENEGFRDAGYTFETCEQTGEGKWEKGFIYEENHWCRINGLHDCYDSGFYGIFGSFSEMKIYNRKDFLNLPEGTIFSKGREWFFHDFMVKGETLKNEINDVDYDDFLYLDLMIIQSEGSDDLFNKLDDMKKKGKSYPINEDVGRDGMYEKEDLFLVFEKEDLISLREYITTAIGE